MRKFLFKKIYNYIKEMHELKKQNNKLYWENWECRYVVSCYNQKFENTIGSIESVLKCNNPEDVKYYAKNALMYMDTYKDTIEEIKKKLKVSEAIAKLVKK